MVEHFSFQSLISALTSENHPTNYTRYEQKNYAGFVSTQLTKEQVLANKELNSDCLFQKYWYWARFVGVMWSCNKGLLTHSVITVCFHFVFSFHSQCCVVVVVVVVVVDVVVVVVVVTLQLLTSNARQQRHCYHEVWIIRPHYNCAEIYFAAANNVKIQSKTTMIDSWCSFTLSWTFRHSVEKGRFLGYCVRNIGQT